ncbi:hypothetical protein JRO89_XS03G0054100 [Xanthoceras sorbifolium]|uniref:Uncharacterized protein n=1 Tax=Xanthoceras sorbifolium TaxID=99658 RepID=A0ABQ8I8S5_9ROSI|nr:hypothetical protein JRO89_XS03G0054100 [Xanthoceras sorbifolium]
MLRLFGTLIHAYLKVDRIGNALQMFNQMADSGLIRRLLNEDLLNLSKDVIDQIMRASVGITPALHNFVSEAFGQVVRGSCNLVLNDMVLNDMMLKSIISNHKVAAVVVVVAVVVTTIVAAATKSMEAKVSEDTYAAY